MRAKASEAQTTLNTINRSTLPDEALSKLLTESFGFLLHNIDEENFYLLENVKMPEKFDKMNNWMFDRIFMRLHPYLAMQKTIVASKFFKLLSVLSIPDTQLDYIARLLKSLVEDAEYQAKAALNQDKLVQTFLSAMKKGSKLYEKASKALAK